MFKYKRKKQTVSAKQEEYVEKQVRKIPKILAKVFFVYILIFLVLMVWYFVFKSTHYVSVVQGSSMQPTLNVDIGISSSGKEDYVYVNNKHKGDRGDIVVIDMKTQSNPKADPIIKRLIGKEGDKVSIFLSDDGLYYVNIIYANTSEIIRLEEDYIKSRAEWRYAVTYYQTKEVGGVYYEQMFYNTFLSSSDGITEVDGTLFYEIPKGYCFCLGDNRAYSADSREKGVFEGAKIKGRAEIIVKGGMDGENRNVKKGISAIFSYYWGKLEDLFAR